MASLPTDGAVAVPVVDSPSAVACIRALAKRGVDTVAVAEDESIPALASRYVDDVEFVPPFREDSDAYRDALLDVARSPDVCTVAAFREEDVAVLAHNHDAFAEHVEPMWPDAATLAPAHDRLRLAEAAREAGVAVPDTRLLGDVEDWDRRRVVKTRYGILLPEYVDDLAPEHAGVEGDVQFLTPGEEPDREAVRREFHHDPIVQEYVPGDEYAVWTLYDHGTQVAACEKHQLRAYKYAGGTSICRETVDEPDLAAAGRALLDHLDWHGPASVQFKRHADTGEFVLLEINPRFWASLSCPVRAGLDFPYHFWQVATGRQAPTNPDCETGYATHLLRGELVHLHDVLRGSNPFVDPPPFWRRALAVAASCATQPHFDYLAPDDPAPFLRDALNTAAGALGGLGALDGLTSDGDASRTQDDSTTAEDSSEPRRHA